MRSRISGRAYEISTSVGPLGEVATPTRGQPGRDRVK